MSLSTTECIVLVYHLQTKFHSLANANSSCREIEMINEREKKKQNFMYLIVEFPRVMYNEIEYSIVYFEQDGEEPIQVLCYEDNFLFWIHLRGL